MKKIQLIIIVLISISQVSAQRYNLKIIDTLRTKYTRPPKPDTCFNLEYNDTILGYCSPMYVSYPYVTWEYEKEPTCTATLYNGNSFFIENYGYRYINKDASVLYIWGNKAIPNEDTTVFFMYDGNGNLIHKNKKFGLWSFYPATISDEGYLAARGRIQGKEEFHLVLYSPKGYIVFDKKMDLSIYNIYISPDAQHIACIVGKCKACAT